MRTLVAAVALAAGASAAALPRQDQCCFSLTASGGQSGQVGQLGDGQNRIGGGHPAGQYCLSGSFITDGSGRGCILTPPTTQLQCDEGATPDTGFSVSGSGELQHNGDSTFYACAADDGEYNIYTSTSDAQTQCSQITLSTGGKCGGSGSGGSGSGGAPFSAPASPESSAGSPPGGYGSPSSQPAGSVPGSSPAAPEGTQPAGSEAPPAGYTPPGSSPAASVPGYSPAGPEMTQPTGSQGPPAGYTPPASSPAVPEGTQPAGSVPGSSPAGPEGTRPAGSAPGVSAPPQTGGIQTVTTTVCGCSECAPPGSPAPSAPAGVPSAPGTSAPAPSPSAPGPPQSVPGQSAPAPSAPAPTAPVPSAPGSPESAPGYSAPAPSAPAPSAPGSPAESAPGGSAPAPSAPAPSAPAPSAPGSPAESVPGGSAPAPSAPGQSETFPGNTAPAPSETVPAPTGSAPGGYPSQPATGTQPSDTQPSGSAGSGTGSGGGSACQTSLTPGSYETPHLIVPVNSNAPDQSYGTSYNAYASEANSTIFNFDIPESDAGKTCSLVFLFPRKEDLETTDYTFNGQGSLEFSELSGAVDQQTSYNSRPSKARDLDTVTPQPGGSYIVQSGACKAGSTQTIQMSGSGGLELEFFEDWNPSPLGLFITVC